MDTHDLRLALQQAAPPRSLKGSGGYLLRARIPYWIGMAGALLFVVPFAVIIVTAPNTVEQMIGAIAAQLLIWALAPILLLRHRMKFINRLWCEGWVVPGVVQNENIFRHKDGTNSPTASYLITYTTREGQERSATFITERSNVPPGRPPLLITLDDVPHRVGLIGARHVLMGKTVSTRASVPR